MASSNYMAGRKKYQRPQAMLWSDTPGTLVDGSWVPTGYEKRSDISSLTSDELSNSFLILSDHNRGEINVSTQRIEQRRRMINGTMRSYHNTDKLILSTAWSMLPSRSFALRPDFNPSTGLSDMSGTTDQYTVDGGAGGVEMLEWYKNHTGPFWVFLSYDNYANIGANDAAYQSLGKYIEVVQMYLSSFDYTVVKRGATNHDMWNISINLEEV